MKYMGVTCLTPLHIHFGPESTRSSSATALSPPADSRRAGRRRCAMSAILRFAKSRPILFGAGYSLLKTTGCDLMVQKVLARVEASGPCHQDRHGPSAGSAGAAEWPTPGCQPWAARCHRLGRTEASGQPPPPPPPPPPPLPPPLPPPRMPLSRRVPTTGGREAREHRLEARRHVIGSGEA